MQSQLLTRSQSVCASFLPRSDGMSCCLPQLIGNGLKSWRQYYDLNRTTREGQTALDRMSEWRQNIRQALLMRTHADADQEIDESEDADEEQVLHDEELGAGLLDNEL